MLRRLYDMLFPRACAICGQRLALGEQALCAVCNINLPRTRFTEDPEDNAMAKTISSQMAVERATALYRHLSHSSSGALIYNLKYGGHPEYGDMMGELMAKEIRPTGFFEGIDLLVPIPLTRDRRRQRGYNQSEFIAEGVSRITETPIGKKIVRRTIFHGSQTDRDARARRENVEGVFKLLNPEAVHGRHVLLIDDVCTTGATLSSCGMEIKKAGDVRISVLTLGFAGS